MKVAVPVDDSEQTVQIRTGRAHYFAVYNIDNGTYTLDRLEDNPHGQKHHHDHHEEENHSSSASGEQAEARRLNNHLQSLRAIEDCDYLLAIAVGPYMKKALEELDIEHIKCKKKDGNYAVDLVQKFLDGSLN